MKLVDRRSVLVAAATGLVLGLRMPGSRGQMLSSVGPFSDYRSLVCVFLFGGNDSFNMLVPRSSAEYNAYRAARQNLAIPRDQLLPLMQVGGDGKEYGLHPAMSALPPLFHNGRLAFVANVGPLVQPMTKEEYENRTARVPPQLFSHSDQQAQWQTLRAGSSQKVGWAGRVADLLREAVPQQTISMNISLHGNSLLLTGNQTKAYTVGESGPVVFSRLDNTRRREAFERILNVPYRSIYARAIRDVKGIALAKADLVATALASAQPITTPFPNTTLGRQLFTVARLIAARTQLRMQRQIFFVGVGGFDTHDNQAVTHPRLLGDLSTSLASFYNATVELGLSNSVTTFTQSEFGRTLTSNGDGTDHGWAGVQFVLGDAVRGQRIYGEFPILELNGPRDVGGGRILPSISADQYAATLARWFGVPEHDLIHIAPQLSNFPETDLGFMSA